MREWLFLCYYFVRVNNQEVRGMGILSWEFSVLCEVNEIVCVNIITAVDTRNSMV